MAAKKNILGAETVHHSSTQHKSQHSSQCHQVSDQDNPVVGKTEDIFFQQTENHRAGAGKKHQKKTISAKREVPRNPENLHQCLKKRLLGRTAFLNFRNAPENWNPDHQKQHQEP